MNLCHTTPAVSGISSVDREPVTALLIPRLASPPSSSSSSSSSSSTSTPPLRLPAQRSPPPAEAAEGQSRQVTERPHDIKQADAGPCHDGAPEPPAHLHRLRVAAAETIRPVPARFGGVFPRPALALALALALAPSWPSSPPPSPSICDASTTMRPPTGLTNRCSALGCPTRTGKGKMRESKQQYLHA